jgi:thioredoxin:protein disulfide reductase
MRKLVLLLFAFLFTFASDSKFLSSQDAFKVNIIKEQNKVRFELNIADNIYVYKNKLKVILDDYNEQNIVSKLNLPQFERFHDEDVYFKNLNFDIPYSIIGEAKTIIIKYQGCSTEGLCYSPLSQRVVLKETTASENKEFEEKQIVKIENETDVIVNSLKGDNLFTTLGLFFGFGLLLSLTPCIFPMIPILSGIIVGASKHGKMTALRGFTLSVVYVLSMSIAYTIAGVIAGLFGANLQAYLQNPYVLSIFAFVFVLLAFSMFGYYKLELPHALTQRINKLTHNKEKNGIAGIAIMGFLSALIVGPCVAPPLAGALVYIGQTGDAFLGGIALFAMSLGMGLPLLLIGVGAGKFMPRPGGWMDSVSKIFGIIMLAIALWLLERVIPSSITIYIWVLLLVGTGIYLSKFSHIITKTMALLITVLGVIIFVGAISGSTNLLNPLEKFVSGKVTSQSSELKFKRILSLKELNDEISKSTKPVLIDFTAKWCVACKEFENITFKDEKVIEKLQSFNLIKIDVTDNSESEKQIMDNFNLFGPPSILFFKDKNELKELRIIGYKNPEEFLNHLKKE